MRFTRALLGSSGTFSDLIPFRKRFEEAVGQACENTSVPSHPTRRSVFPNPAVRQSSTKVDPKVKTIFSLQ
jgi:hypothetical protein